MSPETLLLILLGALGTAGFMTRSWLALLAPFLAVPAFYLGLEREWWGDGLGDGWQFAMFAVLAIAVVATAAGLALRHSAGFIRRADRGRG
jgi:hypothetical protein